MSNVSRFRSAEIGDKGYVQGDIVILTEPLPVPNGTEVEISLTPLNGRRNTGRKAKRGQRDVRPDSRRCGNSAGRA